jgi:hypothetical protein
VNTYYIQLAAAKATQDKYDISADSFSESSIPAKMAGKLDKWARTWHDVQHSKIAYGSLHNTNDRLLVR